LDVTVEKSSAGELQFVSSKTWFEEQLNIEPEVLMTASSAQFGGCARLIFAVAAE
jgi:hypothetical protein